MFIKIDRKFPNLLGLMVHKDIKSGGYKTQVTGHKCRFECYGKKTTLKVSSPSFNPKSKTVVVIIVIWLYGGGGDLSQLFLNRSVACTCEL